MKNKADIWTNRKNALLNFVENEKTRVNSKIVRNSNAIRGAAGNGEESTVDFEKDYMQLPLFLRKYEQRQRIVCDSLLLHLRQFTNEVAGYLDISGDKIGSYSQRHLWRVLLNKASTDLLIIQGAVQQRSTEDEDKPYGEVSRHTLIKADIIAEHALKPAVANGFLDQTPIFTFLKEYISIREVPYAEVAMISVAFAGMEPDEGKFTFSKVSPDMLAIPHEVGHHLYRKGHMPGDENESISSYLQDQLDLAQIEVGDWRRNWLEEIFADAYGFLVAGPVMALSFQDLLTDDPPAHFIEDTGRHPIPALRPYIQTQIMRRINYAEENLLHDPALDRLDRQWEDRVANNFSEELAGLNPLNVNYKLHGVADPMQGQQILDTVDEIIKIVLNTLQRQLPPSKTSNLTHNNWESWTKEKDVQDVEYLNELYDKVTFKKFFPFKNYWSKDQVTPIPASDEDWPEQITSGWKEKAPEDHGG